MEELFTRRFKEGVRGVSGVSMDTPYFRIESNKKINNQKILISSSFEKNPDTPISNS
jgi:hypothetical protein